MEDFNTLDFSSLQEQLNAQQTSQSDTTKRRRKMVVALLIVVSLFMLVLCIVFLLFEAFLAAGIAFLTFIASLIAAAILDGSSNEYNTIKNNHKKAQALIAHVLKEDKVPNANAGLIAIAVIGLLFGGVIGLALLARLFETQVTDGIESIEAFTERVAPDASQWVQIFVWTFIIQLIIVGAILLGVVVFRGIGGMLMPSRYEHRLLYDLQTYCVRFLLFISLSIPI